jgi:hypothetical protein
MKKTSTYAATGVLLALVGVVLIRYLVNAPVRTAKANLIAINAITVGQTTEADLLRRAEFQKLVRTCFGADCLYQMVAENSLLARLRLAPRTSLWTMVNVRDGIVTRVSVLAWRAGTPGLSLNQEMQVTDCDYSPCVRELITPNRVLRSTRISFNNRSEIRNHVPEAVNSACLSRLNGCQSNSELMPVLLEITQTGRR